MHSGRRNYLLWYEMHDYISAVIGKVGSGHPSLSCFDDRDKICAFKQFAKSTCTSVVLDVNVRKGGEVGLTAGRAAG